MTGSIQKRGDSYLLTVSNGKGLEGKRDRVTRTVKPEGKTEAEKLKYVEKQLALFIAEVEKGQINSTNLTFEGFSQKWLKDHAEKNLELKTVHEYKALLNLRIIPGLGHIKLSKLKPTHFIEFYNNLTEEGIRLDTIYVPKEKMIEELSLYSMEKFSRIVNISSKTTKQIKLKKGVKLDIAEKVAKAFDLKIEDLFEMKTKPNLSKSTLTHYHRLINSMLNTAVTWGVINSNPAKGIKVPKVQRESMETDKLKFYDIEQTEELVKSLSGEPIKYQSLVMLTLYTGVREGELMGLDIQDINLEKAFLRVNETSQYIPGKGTFKKDKPKTASSKREIAFAYEIIPILKKYLQWRNEQKLKCGDKWTESNRLFVQEDGKPMNTYTPAKWFRKFLAKKRLPPLTFHGLRHTHPTLLLGMGFKDLKEISSRLGHTDIRTTANIYAHQLKSVDRQAADIFGAKLNKDSNIEKGSEAI
jgi:integrase